METIESRVRDLIRASTLSQADFARAVAMDAPKLSKSLGGRRRFSSLDLARIAEFAGVSVDFLLTGHEPGIALAARRDAGSSATDAVAIAQDFAVRREGLAALGYHQDLCLPVPIRLTGRWIDQGEALAESALGMVQEAGRAVREPLTNLIPDVFGIDVGVRDLGDQFDGLAVVTEHLRLILASPGALPGRQRFTIAHELGHVLVSDDQRIHADEDIYGKESRSGESEVRANAFAAAFLMPASVLAARPPGDEVEFCRLALDLQVSPSALAYRLCNLGIIGEAVREEWRRFTAASAAARAGVVGAVAGGQVASLAPVPPVLLLRDTFAAYQAGHITLRPYAQLLGVDTETLREQLAEVTPA